MLEAFRLASLFVHITISEFCTNLKLNNWQVVELGDFTFKSNFKRGSLASDLQGHSHRHLSDYLSSSSGDFFPMGFQLDDFYDHYQLNFSNFEVRIPYSSVLLMV